MTILAIDDEPVMLVHLETELNGTHTFRWESERGFHSPDEDDLRVRCTWEHESELRR